MGGGGGLWVGDEEEKGCVEIRGIVLYWKLFSSTVLLRAYPFC